MDADNEQDEPRQVVVKAPGQARRAKLTPAPDTDPSPEVPVRLRDEPSTDAAEPASVPGSARRRTVKQGENDDRLRRDRPPHW